MKRLLALLALLLVMPGCAGTDLFRGPPSPYTDVQIRSICPKTGKMGKPQKIRFVVKNTGDKDWPSTFISVPTDDFTVLGVSGRRTPDINEDLMSGLPVGHRTSFYALVSPKHTGILTFRVAVWGGKEKTTQSFADHQREAVVPDDLEYGTCRLTIERSLRNP